MFDKNKFSQILKNISEEYENQREFSKSSNINRTYLSQYINMKINKPPKPEILKKLADSSKGTVTYEELMEICGYKDESLKTITYNCYLDIKKFIKKHFEDDYTEIVSYCLNDFRDYINQLKENINHSLNCKILLNDFFNEKYFIEDYTNVSIFLYIYNTLINYLEIKGYIKLINYTFINWIEIKNIYSNISLLNDFELLSYNSKNITFINIASNKENIFKILNDFISFMTMSYLSDVDNNELTQLFKNEVLKNDKNIINENCKLKTSVSLGNTLNTSRIKKSLSIEEVATKVNIDKEDLIKYENGTITPSLTILKKLANIYNISYSELEAFALKYVIDEEHQDMSIELKNFSSDDLELLINQIKIIRVKNGEITL